MCQFNFILTKESANTKVIEDILGSNGFGASKLKNEYIINQTDELKQIFITTSGDCDCGSIIGIDLVSTSNTLDIEKERNKLKRKKWSKSKIERYISDKLKTQDRAEEKTGLGNKSEESRWLKLINDLSKAKIDFGILKHQFTGSLTDEKLNLTSARIIAASKLNGRELRTLEDGKLLNIINS